MGWSGQPYCMEEPNFKKDDDADGIMDLVFEGFCVQVFGSR